MELNILKRGWLIVLSDDCKFTLSYVALLPCDDQEEAGTAHPMHDNKLTIVALKGWLEK